MRVLTWNSQGAKLKAYEWRLQSYEPDVFVVQECGNLPKELGVDFAEDKKPQKVGAVAGYNCWWLSWSRTGPNGGGNIRCSLAMFFKEGGGPVALESNDDYKRPVMKKTIGGVWVYNVHAGGLDYIDEVLDSAKQWGKNTGWVVAGDFNQTPGTITLIKGEKPFVIYPSKATRPQSGRTIDFAVSTMDGKAELLPNYEGSDHRAVVIELA